MSGIRFVFLFLCCLVVGIAPEVQAGEQRKAAPEAGVVLSVKGAVTYAAGKSAPAEVKAYMKVESGDTVTVPAGGAVEIAYFSGNRREKWEGPAVFTVEASGGRTAGGVAGKKPEIGTVPAAASYGVKRLPEFLRKAGYGRSGVTAVRSLQGDAEKKPDRVPSKPEAEEIEAARRAAEEMEKSAGPEDVTPELSMLCILAEYGQFGEMEKVLAEAQKKHPGNPELAAVKSWVAQERTAR